MVREVPFLARRAAPERGQLGPWQLRLADGQPRSGKSRTGRAGPLALRLARGVFRSLAGWGTAPDAAGAGPAAGALERPGGSGEGPRHLPAPGGRPGFEGPFQLPPP